MDTKNLNRKGVRNWNKIKRNVKGLNITTLRDNNFEEPTISKDGLKGFRCRALLVNHSTIDFKSVFIAEQVAKTSNG